MGKVSSAIIDTENVYEDLKIAANASRVPVEDVDVDILEIRTKYILGNENAQNVDDVSIFDDDEFFANPELSIEQSYRVRYYDKKVTNKILLPKISISTNKNFTKIRAKIFANNNIKYSTNFSDELENAINRTLLKYGFLIGIRNSTLKSELKRIASIIRVNGGLHKDVVFDVAHGIEPIYPIDDTLIFHYKDKEDDDPNASVLCVVAENEVVIEYIKSKTGKNGRDLKGQIIEVQEPKTENANINIKTTNKIRKEEDENSIKYIANSQGYVSDDGGVYDIKEKLEVDSINLKTTGSIDAGLDSDVIINVTQSDVMQDAIGAGMSIETSILNVEGSVAESANIKAKSVKIGGLTHAKSFIHSIDAQISTHLGTLECENEATIKRLEGGKVKAKIATIGSVLGGEIVAQTVYINELFSNCTIVAAKLVVISQLKGCDNRIIIDITQIPEFKEKLKIFTQEKQNLTRELTKLKQNLQDKKSLIDANSSSVLYVKKCIEEISQKGGETPLGLINKLKDYQNLVHDYNALTRHYKMQKERYDEVIASLQDIQNMIFSSKIINKGRWIELNDIKFELIEPKKSITYTTKNDELARVIMIKHLKIAGEHIYEIKKTNELPSELL